MKNGLDLFLNYGLAEAALWTAALGARGREREREGRVTGLRRLRAGVQPVTVTLTVTVSVPRSRPRSFCFRIKK